MESSDYMKRSDGMKRSSRLDRSESRRKRLGTRRLERRPLLRASLALMSTVAFALLLLAYSVPRAAALQSKSPETLPLQVVIKPALPHPRSHGPIVVRATLVNSGAEILTGRVRFERSSVFVGHTTGELTLRPGEQEYRWTLPPLKSISRFDPVVVRVRFVATDGTLGKLSEILIAVQNRGQNSFGIGACRAEGAPPITAALDAFDFDDGKIDPQGTTVFSSTWLHRFTADEAPGDPLELCAYDALFLSSGGFSQLSVDALRAIEAWVRAGGSVAVVARRGLSQDHRRCLDTLSQGGWVDGVMVRSNLDLGRVVVAPEDVDFASSAWRSAVNSLWKLRLLQADRVEGGSTLILDDGPRRRPFRAEPEVLITRLRDGLGLSTVRVIPWWGVALILTLLVGTIGPVEQRLLKLLKRRTLTWIAFPALCIAATVFIVWFSTWFVGRSVTSSLTVYDLGADQRVLRRNSFELLFPTAHGDRVLTAENEILTTIRPDGGRRSRGLTTSGSRGRYPQEYELFHREAKWTPYLTRRFSIGGVADVPLPKLAVPESFRGDPALFRSSEQLVDNVADIRDDFDALQLLVVKGRGVTSTRVQGGSMQIGNDVIAGLTTHSKRGLFWVFGLTSPHGSADLGDVVVQGDRGVTIAVLARRGREYFLFRRTYPGGTP